MAQEAEALAIHSMFLDSLTCLFWIIGLIFLLYRFRHSKIKIYTILKVSAILFFLSNAVAFFIRFLDDYAAYRIFVQFYEDDYVDYPMFKFYRNALMTYCIVYFPLPCATFYLFILARLRITFFGTMYAISKKYFIITGFIGIVSLVLYTWWQMLVVYIVFYDPNYPLTMTTYNFGQFSVYQFYVIDPLIRISVIYAFNRRLFKLIVLQREDISGFGESSDRKDSLLTQLNDRQEKLVKTITKQTLLICLMIIGNLAYTIWIEAGQSNDAEGEITPIDVLTEYLFFAVTILQLLCVYLGFDFAATWYKKCCNHKHLLCEQCCRRYAVRKVTVEVRNEYAMLKEEDEESVL